MPGTALQVETAVTPQTVISGHDPMQTRWCFQGAVRDKFLEGSKAGFSELAFAKWQRVPHFTTPEEIHSTDDDPNFARERMVTKTAQSAERYLDSVLGGKTVYGQPDPQKDDWGIRFGFYGEESEAKMAVISATILPSLPEIRQIAQNFNMPSPIGDRCEGEDTVGFGERQSCPTCWASWIQSDCCARFMREVAMNGRQVEVLDVVSRATQKQIITPTIDELEQGQRVMTESLKRGLLANQKVWTEVAMELEKGERRGTDAYQNNIRKDLHATKPQDAQLAQITAYAKAVNANQVQPASGNDFTDEEMAKIYADRVAAKQAAIVPQELGAIDETFSIGQPVLCDGAPGVIAEAKAAGWFDVALDNGETKTVRKDKLQGR